MKYCRLLAVPVVLGLVLVGCVGGGSSGRIAGEQSARGGEAQSARGGMQKASSQGQSAFDELGATDATIRKSTNDHRKYRHLMLDNGLRVLLVSDLEADKSAASMTVFRGSYHDSAERPGLAHFLEHMLFIGTEKYPEPDGYFKYIQSHGGGANAYTAGDHTNYFFDIQPEFFHEGLDRFAQFFISPSFDKDYVEQEKNAVDSEYQLHLKEDNWRGYAVQKALFNPEHPAAQFNIGTLDTLAGDVHSSLLEFFRNNYSANQMGLVVLTNEPLYLMEPLVKEIFSPIKNRELEPDNKNIPLFTRDQLPATLDYQTLKDEYSLSFVFPIPPQLPLYRSKPSHYVSDLLGHEGEGSLHHALTQKGWITSLVAGSDDTDQYNSQMHLTLGLTEEGRRATASIISWVFDYLSLLRRSDIERWRYQELAILSELAFRFQEKGSSMATVSRLSPMLEHYPTEDLLAAPYMMEKFNGWEIGRITASLHQSNAAIILSGPDIRGRQTEKWFSVPYNLVRGGTPISDNSEAKLALPGPNPFLPKSLLNLPSDTLLPQQLSTPGPIDIYLDTDVEFGTPRAVMQLILQTPGGLLSLQDVVRGSLYAALVRDDLNTLAYPALLAGLGYKVHGDPKGFILAVTGYNEKQLKLLQEMLSSFASFDIDPERFRILKEEQERNFANAAKDTPYQQVLSRLRNHVVSSSWTPEEKLAALKQVTLQDLDAWRDAKLSSLSVQALLVGYLDAKDAQNLGILLKRYLPLAEVKVPAPTNRLITDSKEIDLAIDHDDAAMALYMQNDTTETADRALTGLLAHVLRPAYFASLRTEDQLGYVVSVRPMVYRKRSGLAFVVQSPNASADSLKQRTIEFMDEQRERLLAMSDDEFSENRDGFIARLTQKDTSLDERANRYWYDLDLGVTSFDVYQQIADSLAEVTKAELLERLDSFRAKVQDRYVMVYSDGKFAGGQTSGGE